MIRGYRDFIGHGIPLDLSRIVVGGISIHYVDSVGVIIDSKFTWKPQIEAVAKRVNRAIYSLQFFRHFTSFNLRKQLVSALALCYLDYCSLVYSNISDELRLKLQRLQNKCIRYVTGLRRDDHVTPARRQLNWLTTDMRRMYFSAIIIYIACRIGQPSYLAELFEKRVYTRPVRGDVIPELKLPKLSTVTGRSSLSYKAVKFWNELPNRIRDIPSLGSFKIALYRHLFAIDR